MDSIVVELALDFVTSGGNTGNGKYFYSFSPEIVHIDKSPITLTYQFSASTAQNFRILDVFTTDSKFQFGPAKVAKDGRSISMMHLNTVRQLVFLSLLVENTDTGDRINCDPQVTNVPGETT